MSDSVLNAVQLNFDADAQWILNIVLAFVMFGIALEISIQDFKVMFQRPKSIFAGLLSQFLVLPAITFLLIFILKPEASIALGIFLVAACPGGNVSNFMAHLAKANTALSVSLTAAATLLSVVMTPINLQLWGSAYEPSSHLLNAVSVSPFEMIKLVALLLGLPLLLGMLLHHKYPLLAKKLAKILKVVSLSIFMLLIFVALYNNSAIFMEYVLYVFWIVLAHNGIAFFTGFSLARLFGLSQKDTRSITIETGIQNSGLGLILVFSFFDGHGGMALVAAFWGIWHLVSGLLLAGFWSRKPL